MSNNDLEHRRIALGDHLAILRASAGLSGRGLASAAKWQASKVSRIENGKQNVTDLDIKTWCEVTGANQMAFDQLRDELRAIRADETRWARQLSAGHRSLQDDMLSLEQRSQTIRVFDLALIPGLVQTAEYARTLFVALANIRQLEPDTDDAVRSRLQRQQVLYDSTKKIDLLTSELALRHPIGNKSVMAGQLDRLLALEGLATVRFGILPTGCPVPIPLIHGFCILDDQVLAETWHREVNADLPEDVALYNRVADALWSVASTGDVARQIIRAVARDLS